MSSLPVDPELCRAVGTILAESAGRALTVRQLSTYVGPYVRTPAGVDDVQRVVLHLEARGDVRRLADPDNPAFLFWTLTDSGKTRFAL